MAIQFSDLPASYRFCQGAIVSAVGLAVSSATVFTSDLPHQIKVGLGLLLGTVVAASLLLSIYVVIRYPYLSLIRPVDGDHLDRQTSHRTKPLVLALKQLAMAFCIMAVVLIPINGFDTRTKALAFCYFLAMIPCLFFLTYLYQPSLHPTIATFSHATLGIGLILFPLYVPVLAIGATRCKHFVDTIEADWD